MRSTPEAGHEQQWPVERKIGRWVSVFYAPMPQALQVVLGEGCRKTEGHRTTMAYFTASRLYDRDRLQHRAVSP
jgi:hypothetical protein